MYKKITTLLMLSESLIFMSLEEFDFYVKKNHSKIIRKEDIFNNLLIQYQWAKIRAMIKYCDKSIINRINENGETTLLIALNHNCPEDILRYIIYNSSNDIFMRIDKYGRNHMHYVASHVTDFNFISYAFKKTPLPLINIKDKEDISPNDLAKRYGNKIYLAMQTVNSKL